MHIHSKQLNVFFLVNIDHLIGFHLDMRGIVRQGVVYQMSAFGENKQPVGPETFRLLLDGCLECLMRCPGCFTDFNWIIGFISMMITCSILVPKVLGRTTDQNSTMCQRWILGRGNGGAPLIFYAKCRHLADVINVAFEVPMLDARH